MEEKGWADLLRLAGPQKWMIFLASAVLFVRLPFSLAVPHFVSMTLGAIIDGDGEAARRCVVWLVCCGTIDALVREGRGNTKKGRKERRKEGRKEGRRRKMGW